MLLQDQWEMFFQMIVLVSVLRRRWLRGNDQLMGMKLWVELWRNLVGPHHRPSVKLIRGRVWVQRRMWGGRIAYEPVLVRPNRLR